MALRRAALHQSAEEGTMGHPLCDHHAVHVRLVFFFKNSMASLKSLPDLLVVHFRFLPAPPSSLQNDCHSCHPPPPTRPMAQESTTCSKRERGGGTDGFSLSLLTFPHSSNFADSPPPLLRNLILHLTVRGALRRFHICRCHLA